MWLFYGEGGKFTSCYGNFEIQVVRTELGIDTHDHALDIVVDAKSRWLWKDEAEFNRRRDIGIDSAEHQVAVRAAGWDLIRCQE